MDVILKIPLGFEDVKEIEKELLHSLFTWCFTFFVYDSAAHHTVL